MPTFYVELFSTPRAKLAVGLVSIAFLVVVAVVASLVRLVLASVAASMLLLAPIIAAIVGITASFSVHTLSAMAFNGLFAAAVPTQLAMLVGLTVILP